MTKKLAVPDGVYVDEQEVDTNTQLLEAVMTRINKYLTDLAENGKSFRDKFPDAKDIPIDSVNEYFEWANKNLDRSQAIEGDVLNLYKGAQTIAVFGVFAMQLRDLAKQIEECSEMDICMEICNNMRDQGLKIIAVKQH